LEGFTGILFGLIGLALIKARYPNSVQFRRAFHNVLLGKRGLGSLDPDQFASAVLKQSKDVFDKLAEM